MFLDRYFVYFRNAIYFYFNVRYKSGNDIIYVCFFWLLWI